MRVKWDAVGEKTYEAGVDHCVHYLQDTATGEYTGGQAWNGITSIAETPDGGEPNKQYADNIAYLSIMGKEDLNGTIEAFTYPPKTWPLCDGSATVAKGARIFQQNRRTFGLCYRTKIGNDVDGLEHGFLLHLLYGAKVSPSDRTYETMDDSPEPINFSWEYNTTPVQVTGYEPTSLMVIDSRDCDPTKLNQLLDILYGTDATGAAEGDEATGGTDARLPLPDEVIGILGDASEASINAARMSSRLRTSL